MSDVQQVRADFIALQNRLVEALEAIDGKNSFSDEQFNTDQGGLARPRVLTDGPVIEKAAVQFTHSIGTSLPAAATERHPELANMPFEALAVSTIVHPKNPYVPTSHMNLRYFLVHQDGSQNGGNDSQQDDGHADPGWHFGGGFDLTPYYGFKEDAIHFHRMAHAACAPFGDDLYFKLKKWCDDYFFIPHRQEARGIGGIFFDDWTTGGFDQSLAFVRAVGDHYLKAYLPIFERRKNTPYSDIERDFQLFRRGRYVEFNLCTDRGTRYGLQSGRRIESVLASLPPLVSWKYNWQPKPDSPEDRLYEDFLKPRDWLSD